MTRKMKDSGIEWIGEIPEDWKVLPNKYLMEKLKIINEIYKGEDILSLTKNGVIVRDLSEGGKMPVSFNGYQTLKKGNLLFCLFDYDVTPRTVGKIDKDGISSPAYSQYVMKNIATRDYYYYFYLLLDYTKELLHLSKNLRSSFSEFEFGLIEAPVPKNSEQIRISNFLDKKTEQIENIKSTIMKEIQTLEDYKKSVITEAVTKGLDKSVEMKDSGIEWIGKIPNNWEVTKVKYIGKLQNGISKNGEFFGKGYPFVSYGDVYKNFSIPNNVKGLIQSNLSEQSLYSVKKGDVFFTRTSETLEEIGYSSVCLQDLPKATFAGFLIRLRPYKSSKIIPNFSKYYFRSEHLREYLAKEMTIVTRASLGQQLLNDMVVLLPSIEEQKKIINYLDKKCGLIDRSIESKQKQLEVLEEYKKSLIYEYVTGKKEVL